MTASTLRAARTTALVLYQGNDYERLAEARNKLEMAKRNRSADETPGEDPARGGDGDAVAEASEEYEAILAQVLENATEVRVKGIGRKRWRALLAEHKPKPGDEGDQTAGFDRDTFPDVVIDHCLVEPELSGAEREAWLDDLTEGEANAIFSAAFGLNENPPIPPKALSLAAR